MGLSPHHTKARCSLGMNILTEVGEANVSDFAAKQSQRIKSRGGEMSVGLILYEFKPLVAVEPEAGVARQERDMLGDGVRHDDVVAWVAVVLLLVQL